MSAGSFNLFVYGTLRAAATAGHLLERCERIADATVNGTLYDIAGRFPALLLYGEGLVRGEVWRCPTEVLGLLDAYEGVRERLFRRVAVRVDDLPCWTYVAGPALSRELTPTRRVASGDWLNREGALPSVWSPGSGEGALPSV